MTALIAVFGTASPLLAALPESFVVTVDKGGGEMVELTLTKHSVRPPNFRVVSWDSTVGYVEEHTASNPALPARTYRGYVSENPNELVLAVVHTDNTLDAQSHDGSGLLWQVASVDVTAELGNGTSTTPTPAPLAVGSGTTVAPNLPGQFLPPTGLYQAHGVEDVTSQFYDLNGQSVEETLVWLESQWNVLDFFNARDTKLSMQLTEVIIRKDQFYTPTAGNAGEFNSALHTEWQAQGQNARGFVHSWFPYNFTFAGGYSSGNNFYNVGGHNVTVNALYHEAAHGWRAQHYFYGRETMTGSHPSHGEMNTQRVLYTRQIEIDQNDGIVALSSYPTNLHPRAYQDVASTLLNTATDITPLANDYDANGDVISIKSFDATTAKGGTVTQSGDTLTYTPASDYVGKDVIVYEVQDAPGLYTKGVIHIEVINQGLAGQWSMEETSGTSAVDGSGLSHTGTLVGADFSSDSITGPVGNALALGAADYVIGDDSNLITGSNVTYPMDAPSSNFFDPMDQSYTASTWFKLAPGSTSANLFSKRNGAGLGYSFNVTTTSGLAAQLKPWDGLEGAKSVSGGTVATDTWYHAAMVINRDDNTLRIYLNGAEVGTAATLSADFFIFNGREDLKIGGGSAFSIDDARIYTKALSLSEIQALRNAGDVPAGQPSPSDLALNTSSSSTLSWLAGNGSYQHDVYFGTDEAAVTNATTASSEYQGRQAGTSFDPSALNFGQNYFWRVDEVDGSTIIAGQTWKFSTAASALTENLVLHFSMDNSDVQIADTTVHTVNDIAFPAQNFTPISITPAMTGVTGVIGQAINLSGTADTLRSQTTSPVKRPASGGVTISFWINTTSTASTTKIYDGGGAYFMRYHNGDLQPVFDGSAGGSIIFDTNVNDGQWHHVVAHNDGANLTTVYVDGVSAGTQTEGLYDIAPLNRHFSIGATYGTANFENFQGSIDDFGVWERSLSSAEITTIHTAGLAGNSLNDVPVIINSSLEVADGFTGFTVGGLTALGTVTDNKGVIWTGVSDSQIWNRTDIAPAGVQALALGVGGSNGQTDISIPGTNHGVSMVSFDYASFSSGANATFKLLYNDNTGSGWVEAWSTQVVGMNPKFATKPWANVTLILNVPGDVDLRFETTGSQGAMIDNVKVRGLANQAPTVNDIASNVAENVVSGSTVTTVTHSDPNSADTISFAITGGNTNNAFAIDSNTGVITTATALDFEGTPSYSLIVTGTDSGGLTDTGTVTITVTNINEAPTATDTSGSLAENGSANAAVATVSSSDPDAGDTPSFAITGGNGSGLFAIDASGNVTTTGALNFEATAQHILTVTVTDGGSLTDTANVTVNVTNVNEAPVAADNSGSVAENASAGAAIATVAVTDPDASDTKSFAITSGNTGGAFAINSSTGAITTTTALDFEAVVQYNLVVTVTDSGSLTDTANVTVNVTNVNEAPVFSADPINKPDANASVAYSDTLAGSATDVDASDTLSYSKLTGPAWLTVASNGALSGTPSNSDSGPNAFSVQVSDGNGGTDTATLNITVIAGTGEIFSDDFERTTGTTIANGWIEQTNDSRIYNTNNVATQMVISVSSGVQYAMLNKLTNTFTAGDRYELTWNGARAATATGTLVYDVSIGTWDGATFTPLATEAGSLPNVTLLNKKTGTSVYFTASAAEAGQQIAIRFETVTGSSTWAGFDDIAVNNLGANTAPSISDATFSLAENSSAVTAVGSVSATDSDTGDTVSYSITGGNTGGEFAIDANNGAITTTTALDFEAASSHVLTVTATDAGGLTNDALVTVNVTNVNEAPVTSDNSGSIAEDATTGAAVVTAAVTDPDASDTTSFAITSGNTGNVFAIDNSGNITTAAALDFETTSQYTLLVTVTDGGSLTDTATITVTVTNANEAPSLTNIVGTDADEAQAYSGSIANGTDPDAGDTLTYSKVSGPAWLTVASNGSLTGTPSSSDVGVNQWTVRVTDAGALSADATLTITVNAIPVTSISTIAETTTSGTSNGTYVSVQSNDGVLQVLAEKLQGRNSKAKSLLEHQWEFSIVAGSDVTLRVDAFHSANTEGDDFILAYSTDGATYTDALTVTKIIDDGVEQTASLPASLSGTVYIRVKDADQTRGNSQQDSLYVDLVSIEVTP